MSDKTWLRKEALQATKSPGGEERDRVLKCICSDISRNLQTSQHLACSTSWNDYCCVFLQSNEAYQKPSSIST